MDRGRLIEVAAGRRPAELLLRNARVVNVFTHEIRETSVAVSGGLIAGLVGHGEIFVSGGAEHQGPDGGGPIAIIYDTRIGASP